jgi:predicted nucleotidyltransferase
LKKHIHIILEPGMKTHHRRVVDRLVDTFSNHPDYPALILGGSIVRGWERDDSDVDVIFVASDDAYARFQSTKNYHYFNRELCDYAGGYIDGKIVDVSFLEEVALHGSEPARSAFVNGVILYSRIPGLDDLVKRCAAYPEHQRSDKIASFYAQVQAMQWYVGEALKRNDPYLMMHMLSDLVLFGGRMILAHNRILFPYHKWFLTALRSAPEKPDNFVEMIEALLAQPSQERVEAFCSAVLNFTNWEVPAESWPVRFMEDAEWGWRTGRMGLADW